MAKRTKKAADLLAENWRLRREVATLKASLAAATAERDAAERMRRTERDHAAIFDD